MLGEFETSPLYSYQFVIGFTNSPQSFPKSCVTSFLEEKAIMQ